VGTVSIGKPGGRNAGILAAQILGSTDPLIAQRLDSFKQDMAREVAQKAEKLGQPQ
jgi:phosphoribosylcarboxyaminoimidazole (NCAIR) mutase